MLPRHIVGEVSECGRQWLVRHRGLALALILAGIGLHVFVEMADELHEGELLAVDQVILDTIRPYRTPPLDTMAFALSALVLWPHVLLLALPFLLYLACTRRYHATLALLVIPLGTVLVVELLKVVFHRDRPITAVVEEIGHSFPSAHATGATVLYGLLGYVAWRFMTTNRWARLITATVTLALIIATGLARAYLEVHYPSDVLAGWAAGVFLLSGSLIALETWPRLRVSEGTAADRG
ncbi:MAG: phosphatase PAP2 family protein [Armatimonadota bacterium]